MNPPNEEKKLRDDFMYWPIVRATHIFRTLTGYYKRKYPLMTRLTDKYEATGDYGQGL